MSKDQSKKQTKLKQKKTPTTKQSEQKKETGELTDADLEKVAGGVKKTMQTQV